VGVVDVAVDSATDDTQARRGAGAARAGDRVRAAHAAFLSFFASSSGVLSPLLPHGRAERVARRVADVAAALAVRARCRLARGAGGVPACARVAALQGV
jgi:hypothetical protein